MPGLLRELEGDRLVVAVDPGKVTHRVWLADRERGLIGEPVSVANSRVGIEQLVGLVGGGDPVFAVEATGSLHRAFAGELERRWPGALRLFAPSETQAARAQIGRDGSRPMIVTARRWCGWPPGRRAAAVDSPVEAMLAAVAHRRQLVLALTPLRQRLHDQLNALAPGPVGARKGTAARWRWRRRPDGRCWPARSISRAAPDRARSRRARAGA